MKRWEVIFVSVVFSAILTGFLVDRSHRGDALEAFDFAPPEVIASAPLEAPSGTHRLAGIVLGADDEPAPDVLVHVYPPIAPAGEARPLKRAHTNADGRFELGGLYAGEYRAILLKTGFPNTSVSVSIPSNEVRWHVGEPFGPIETLPDMQRANLRGQVWRARADDAHSLIDYEVLLQPAAGVHELSGAVPRRAKIDPSGAFAVEGLVTAPYQLSVLPPWGRGGSWPFLARQDHEHTTDGAQTVVMVELVSAELSGVLRDPKRRPIEGALIKLWPEGSPKRIWPAESTDADGAFRVRDLAPGPYRLRVRAGAAQLERVLELGPGETLKLETITLDPRASDERDQ